MSADIRKVHVTHEKYATRTIEEELAILNGREWQDSRDAENCAINHGWSICERPNSSLSHSLYGLGPITVFNKDDKFIALNRKIRGNYVRRFVFEKELPHGTFDEELKYLNSSEIPWAGPRPVKPPKKQGEPLLRRIVSVFYDPKYSKWCKEESEWKNKVFSAKLDASRYLLGVGWVVLIADHKFYDADKPVMWEKYGRRITLVPDPDNPYVARFVEVTS